MEIKMNMTVIMCGESIAFNRSVYQATGGIYIGSVIADGQDKGMPFSDFTVCIPEETLGENEVIIPVYKLGKECYNAFKDFLVEKELEPVAHGFAVSMKVLLKPNWHELTQELE